MKIVCINRYIRVLMNGESATPDNESFRLTYPGCDPNEGGPWGTDYQSVNQLPATPDAEYVVLVESLNGSQEVTATVDKVVAPSNLLGASIANDTFVYNDASNTVSPHDPGHASVVLDLSELGFSNAVIPRGGTLSLPMPFAPEVPYTLKATFKNSGGQNVAVRSMVTS